MNLAKAHAGLGDPAMARDRLQQSLATREAHCGADHYADAVTLTNLAHALAGLGVPASVRDMLQRALAINKAHGSAEHW